MRPPIRRAGLAHTGIPTALTVGTLAAIHPALAVALVAPILWAMLSDLAARYLTGHVVYQLHNDTHSVLYVGETNDVNRRMLEHTDGTEHDWYADIYAPLSAVNVSGTGDFYGRLIGKTIGVIGSGALHFDESLALPGGGLAKLVK